jgi:predicted Zn-dependent peptidase
VSSFSRDHVTDFLAAHYVGAQTVVAAAGAVDHDALVTDVTRCFGAMVQGQPGQPVPARFLGGEVREERDVEQVNIAFALPGAALTAEDLHASRVFSSVLGGGMASRLFQEVREKRGLCYTVSSFHWAYADAGLIGFHAGAAPEDVPELVDVMLDVISAAAEDIDESEVLRAKAQARASLLMSLESSPARANRLARQVLLLGEVRPLDEIARRIEAVSVDDVRAAGRGALRAGPAAFAAVGKLGRLASFGEVANTRLGVRSSS